MNHAVIPFDLLHKAKFDNGTAANLPPSPEGLGDAYWAYDTQQLFIADSTASNWVIASGANQLNQLSDIDPDLSPINGGSLYYDSADSLWKGTGGNLNIISTHDMTVDNTDPIISGIDALGTYKYLMFDLALKRTSGTGTARANRVVEINVNSGTSLTTGMYQEWSDLGNAAGTGLLTEALLATNIAGVYASNNFASSRIYIYNRNNGHITMDCISLLFGTSGTYHKLCNQFFFANNSLDSLQIIGTFNISSKFVLYGHR